MGFGSDRLHVRVLVGEGLVGDHLRAFVSRVGDLGREQADGAQGIIVAGDHVVDDGGVAVGVHDCNDRDAELAGLGDGDGFVVGVNDEDRIRQAAHVLDTAQRGRKRLALALQLDDFLLGEQVIAAVGRHVVKLLETLHRLLHRHPVGQQTAQPARVDVRHAGAIGLFGDRVLRLALGADEQHELAGGGQIADELRRLFEHL